MATVYIPALLQRLTGGRREVTVEATTVRQVIENLDREFPGLREALMDGNALRLNISVAVDGEITPLGLLERIGPDSEVHFVAAIRGGAR